MPSLEKTDNFFQNMMENLKKKESEISKEIVHYKDKPLLDDKKKNAISYGAEVKRKLIHLISLNIPMWYIFLDKTLILIILGVLIALSVIIDVSSKRIPIIHNVFEFFFGDILRKHEKKRKKFRLNGGSWLLISAFLTILIFPKFIAVIALTILIISDISSALIGKKFGKTRFFKKSLEGSIAFFLSAGLVVVAFYFIYSAGLPFLWIGIIASLIAAFFEAISKNVKIDDNLLVPLSFSTVMYFGEIIALTYGQPYFNIL